MAETHGTDAWSGLLADAREALANLRADDLELLAFRAEKMLEPPVKAEPPSHEGGGLAGRKLAKLEKEHRLLGDLLRATDDNLQVLHRLRGCIRGHASSRGVNARWVR
jgi:hypothetical protein